MCGMEPAGQQQASSVLGAELLCLLPRSTERQPGQVLLVEWRHLGSRNPALVALRSITGHVHECSYSYTAHRFGAAIKSPCMTSATGHAQSGTVQRAAGPAERGAASTWGSFKTGTAGDRAGAGRAAHLHNPNHCAVVGGPVGQQPGCSATGEDVHAAAGQAHPHALLHPCRAADARTHVLTAPPRTAAIDGGSLRAEAQSVVRKSFQHDIRSKLPADQVYSSIVRDHSSQSRASASQAPVPQCTRLVLQAATNRARGRAAREHSLLASAIWGPCTASAAQGPTSCRGRLSRTPACALHCTTTVYDQQRREPVL